MRRRVVGTWQDRVAWAVIALGIVLLLVPQSGRTSVLLPLQTAVLAPLRGFAALRSQLARQQKENDRLARLAAELAVENARLQTLAGRSAEVPPRGLKLVRAPVVSRDLTTLRHYLVVSRGRRHGIKLGAPVLAPEGVVGRVIKVGEHQSLVQTILEPDSRVSVTNRRSKVTALARPAERHRLALDFVAKGADFRAGDTVVTAGLGGVFPKGLIVGTVVDVLERPSGLFMSVRVQPAADISVLDQVFVLRMPDSTPHDDEWLDNTRPLEVAPPGHPVLP